MKLADFGRFQVDRHVERLAGMRNVVDGFQEMEGLDMSRFLIGSLLSLGMFESNLISIANNTFIMGNNTSFVVNNTPKIEHSYLSLDHYHSLSGDGRRLVSCWTNLPEQWKLCPHLDQCDHC